MFTLAHFSDVHLALRTKPGFADLANKRLTGFVNLKGNRSSHHDDRALHALVADLKAAKPDHVALTGDLVNLALGDEFLNARDWLHMLGRPEWISLVPGNHDTYVSRQPSQGIDLWRDYMCGDDGNDGPLHFPYLRLRGEVAIIGLSSAITTLPFMATGKLGHGQLEKTGQLLAELGRHNRCRVVLIHHPPLEGLCARHKRLLDAPDFARLIAEHGAELVLHGHNHTDTLVYANGSGSPVPVIGVPSASSLGYKNRPPAQYNLIRIARQNSAWRLNLTSRRLDRDSATFADWKSSQIAPSSARVI